MSPVCWLLRSTPFLVAATVILGVCCFGADVEEKLAPELTDDAYFPLFHMRPPSGHVNDPNGPFFDPVHSRFHLFMQYHPYNGATITATSARRGASLGQQAESIGWYHYSSTDLATWTDHGVAIPPDGQGCPNTGGVFTGSTSYIDGVPTIVYPGVHSVPKSPSHPDGIGMAQCMARPTNLSDPFLRQWRSRVYIPTDPVPGDVNNHFHDDAQVWISKSDGRVYTFISGGTANRSAGVNILYSTDLQSFKNNTGTWRLQHSLWNITNDGCNFVSCPEMYPLPGTADDAPRTSGRVVYEAFCGMDRYWLGYYNDSAHTFKPDPSYTNQSLSLGRLAYDYGIGRASKSFWHQESQRRLMWSWLTNTHAADQSWDGMQSVPRQMRLDNRLGRLRINPVVELGLLHRPEQPLAHVNNMTLQPNTPVELKRSDGTPLGDTLDIQLNVSFERMAQTWLAPRVASIRVLAATSTYTSVDVLLATNDTYMVYTDLPGGDISFYDFNLPKNSSGNAIFGPVACARFCNAHPDCTGWVYVTNPGPRCAIKGSNQTAAPRAHDTCISGYKRRAGGTSAVAAAVGAVGVSCTGDQKCTEHTMPLDAKPVITGSPGLGLATLRVLVDRSVLEVYDGLSCMSAYARPPTSLRSNASVVLTTGDTGIHVQGSVFGMGSAALDGMS